MREEIAAFESKLKEWNDGGGEEGAKKRLAADLTQWEKDSAAANANGRTRTRPAESERLHRARHSATSPAACSMARSRRSPG